MVASLYRRSRQDLTSSDMVLLTRSLAELRYAQKGLRSLSQYQEGLYLRLGPHSSVASHCLQMRMTEFARADDRYEPIT